MKKEFFKRTLLITLFMTGLAFISCKKETETTNTVETVEPVETETPNLDTIATETDTVVTTGKQEMSAGEQVP